MTLNQIAGLLGHSDTKSTKGHPRSVSNRRGGKKAISYQASTEPIARELTLSI